MVQKVGRREVYPPVPPPPPPRPLLGYMLYCTLANSCWYMANVKISLILIKKLGGQCDIRYGYLAYVDDCHMTENWMLQTCDFIQII